MGHDGLSVGVLLLVTAWDFGYESFTLFLNPLWFADVCVLSEKVLGLDVKVHAQNVWASLRQLLNIINGLHLSDITTLDIKVEHGGVVKEQAGNTSDTFVTETAIVQRNTGSSGQGEGLQEVINS